MKGCRTYKTKKCYAPLKVPGRSNAWGGPPSPRAKNSDRTREGFLSKRKEQLLKIEFNKQLLFVNLQNPIFSYKIATLLIDNYHKHPQLYIQKQYPTINKGLKKNLIRTEKNNIDNSNTVKKLTKKEFYKVLFLKMSNILKMQTLQNFETYKTSPGVAARGFAAQARLRMGLGRTPNAAPRH
ncbi:MAG: hypothetical protein ACT6RN_26775 [Agrobacterium sp.]|uniref:hypothetical protein n=1 Tax=Agrobacterium sp. TaxID=361 RepID=UPI004037E463